MLHQRIPVGGPHQWFLTFPVSQNNKTAVGFLKTNNTLSHTVQYKQKSVILIITGVYKNVYLLYKIWLKCRVLTYMLCVCTFSLLC